MEKVRVMNLKLRRGSAEIQVQSLPSSLGGNDMAAKTYEVPAGVSSAAKKGLELHWEHGHGGTEVSLEMAEKLSSGEHLSAEEVLHVSKYFPRHAGDNLGQDGSEGAKPSNGYIAWMLWGGDAGREWSEKLKVELEEKS